MDQAQARTRRNNSDNLTEKKGVILLVEDEEMVRNLAKMLLSRQGYTVLEAVSGTEAFSLSQKTEEPIDLLLTDVIMPQMDGRELYGRLKTTKPELKVIFMSGYSEDIVSQDHQIDSSASFIQKPFSVDTLFSKVEEVLGT